LVVFLAFFKIDISVDPNANANANANVNGGCAGVRVMRVWDDAGGVSGPAASTSL